MNQRRKPLQIIGVPLDLGASRRGTDAGPSAMHIAGLHPALESLGYEIDEDTDIQVPTPKAKAPRDGQLRYKAEILACCATLATETLAAMNKGNMPIVIGGDHSIAMGTVNGVAEHHRQKGEDIGLIWFDAHGDMNRPDTSPSGNIHGMPLAHLLGYGDDDLINILHDGPAVKPENVVLIGIRDIDNVEREVIRESGIKAFTMRDIDDLGMAHVVREALEVVCDGTAGFHISFDVDGCDPTVIPGSGTLVPGGVNFREAHQLLEHCAETGKMTSMEIVELNPFLDQANVSAERSLLLLQSALGRSIL